MLPRLYSLLALIAIWAIAAATAQSRLLPGPLTIGAATLSEVRSGELLFQMACTLGRVIASFAIAMVLGGCKEDSPIDLTPASHSWKVARLFRS